MGTLSDPPLCSDSLSPLWERSPLPPRGRVRVRGLTAGRSEKSLQHRARGSPLTLPQRGEGDFARLTAFEQGAILTINLYDDQTSNDCGGTQRDRRRKPWLAA